MFYHSPFHPLVGERVLEINWQICQFASKLFHPYKLAFGDDHNMGESSKARTCALRLTEQMRSDLMGLRL